MEDKASPFPTSHRIDMRLSRLILREFSLDDFNAVHTFASNSEVTYHQPWGPNTPKDTQSFLENCIAQQSSNTRKEFNLALVTIENAKVIGSVRIFLRSSSEAEIGYSLNPEFWNKGYGTEAAWGLLVVAFEQLNVSRVIATVGIENINSLRVLEKIGMKREAFFPKDVKLRDRWRDSYLYTMEKNNYHKKSSTKEYYNEIAEIYLTQRISTACYFPEIISEFFNHIPHNLSLLDAGCGPGEEALIANQYGHNITGIDMSENMINLFKKNLPNAHACIGDICEMPFEDSSFDIIFSAFSLIHIPFEKSEKVISEFQRVIGYLFLGTAIHESSRILTYKHKIVAKMDLSPINFYYWNKDELESLLNSFGFISLDNKSLPLFEGGPLCHFLEMKKI